MVRLHQSSSLSCVEADNTHDPKVTTLTRGQQCHHLPYDQPISNFLLIPQQQHRLQLVRCRQFHKKLVTDQRYETTDFVVVKYTTQYRWILNVHD